MNLQDQASRLESLLPNASSVLFRSDEEDPLRHHSVGQIRLMRALLSGSKTGSELGQILGLSPSSLTQMAGRMIRAGLVAKESDPHDRRVRKLSLTEAGLRLMDGRRAMRARAASRLLRQLNPKQVKDLMEILEDIARLKGSHGFTLMEAAI